MKDRGENHQHGSDDDQNRKYLIELGNVIDFVVGPIEKARHNGNDKELGDIKVHEVSPLKQKIRIRRKWDALLPAHTL